MRLVLIGRSGGHRGCNSLHREVSGPERFGVVDGAPDPRRAYVAQCHAASCGRLGDDERTA
jgi:hypothetical protein